MIKWTLIPFLVFMALISQAFAEYRVYQYYVRSKTMNINPGNATLVTSTLDPVSYTAYHGGKSSVEVNLLRSWMCMGNTAQKSVCTMSAGTELSEAAPVAGALQ
jgi:hypothetical protein